MRTRVLYLLSLAGLCLSFRLTAQTPQVSVFSSLGTEATAVAFTPDNQYLVVGTADGSVVRTTMTHLSDVTRLYKAGEKPIEALTVSNDGKYILSCSEEGKVVLRDNKTGATSEIAVQKFTGQVVQVAFSPDSRIFAVSSRNGVAVYGTETRQQLALKNVLQVSVVRIRPDSKEILIGGKNNTQVILWNWEADTQRLLFEGAGVSGGIATADYSPDGRYLAVGFANDKSVTLLEASTLKDTAKVALPDGIKALRFTLDGQYLATCDGENKVKIWTLPGLKLKLSLREYPEELRNFDFSANGKYFVAADGKAPILLDINWLQLEPWKPADTEAPTISLLSPRYDSGRQMPDGTLYARANQIRTRISCRVNDLGGVALVEINGNRVEPTQLGGNKFEVEEPLQLEENTFIPLTIRAVDKLGNEVIQRYSVEYKPVELVGAENYYALLIAEEDYTDDKIADLDQPAQDAERLAGVLVDRYTFKRENVILVKNPTREQLLRHFSDLQSTLTPSDNLLIFYAGHGTWNESMQQGYWLPSDSDLDATTNWFSNNELKDYINSIKTRHTLLIADACFSGGIFKTRALGEEASIAIEQMYKLKSRKAMTSGALKTVPDKSVFLEFLIGTLEMNTDDFLTAADLFAAFRTKVIDNSPNHQIPLYGEIGSTGDQGGEFVFIRRKQ